MILMKSKPDRTALLSEIMRASTWTEALAWQNCLFARNSIRCQHIDPAHALPEMFSCFGRWWSCPCFRIHTGDELANAETNHAITMGRRGSVAL